jgi:hypothetical protein
MRDCKLLIVALLCCVLGITGCASRKKASVLSDAMVKGVALHGEFDASIYKAFTDNLQRNAALVVQDARHRVEQIRQKYLFLGEQRLAQQLKDILDADEAKFDSLGDTQFSSANEQLLKTILDNQRLHSNDSLKALQDAAGRWKQLVGQYQAKRKETLDKRLQDFIKAEQDWQTFVNGQFDAASKQIDAIETQLNASLKDLNGYIATLQQHYSAIKDGEDQINAYLKEKSALELGLRGLLKGVGLNISTTSLESAIENATGKFQDRLNVVVDDFDKKSASMK